MAFASVGSGRFATWVARPLVHLTPMTMRWNPPPNWPQPDAGWTPPPGWEPPVEWGPAPIGWPLWVEDRQQPIVVQAGQPFLAVSKTPYKTNHTFHLIASVLTCGIWAVTVWPVVIIINRFKKDKTVTRYQ